MSLIFNPQFLKLQVFLLALITASLSLNAQDLVVTNSGDSTNCDILSATENTMKLRCFNDATQRFFKTEIAMTEIADYKLNYYQMGSGKAAYANINKSGDTLSSIENYGLPKVRLAASYGYSFKLGQSAASNAAEREYEKEIRNGNRIGLTFDFFWNEMNGLGFKFHRHRSNANLQIEIELDPTTTETFGAHEQLNIAQYSILYRIRKYSWNDKNCLNLGMGIGLAAYRDEITILLPGAPQSVAEVANCAALELEVSYDIALADNIALSIGGELSGGYFEKSKLEYPDGTTDVVRYEENSGISAGRVGLWAAFVVRL
ncbi:MAG TPA: hypothetical protein VJ911_02975 [Cryomorphaceae bacterium]|nr:hypothetical protein [Cryomorphaceae bacterium]